MHAQVLENPHIGSKSYLSSDYLNMFTEIVILLEEVVDHPDYLGDIREWEAKSYCDHFAASSLPFSNLAIWAYEHAPAVTLGEFKGLIDHAVALIVSSRAEIEAAVKSGTLGALRGRLADQTGEIRHTLDQAGALIDRSEHHVSQADVDRLLGF